MAPDALLGSALRIDDFDEYDDDGSAVDEEEENGAREAASVQDSIQTGGQLYRAAYPFQPEAPQEMGLAEGGERHNLVSISNIADYFWLYAMLCADLVRVWEQLCDGWVVGGKVIYRASDGREEEEVETGLIPQNYLVPVEEQPPPSVPPQDVHEKEHRHSVHEEKILDDNNLKKEDESSGEEAVKDL